jgi:hypothetical protein
MEQSAGTNIGIIARIKINSDATLIFVYNSFFLAFYCLVFPLCCMSNGTDISQSGLPPERTVCAILSAVVV